MVLGQRDGGLVVIVGQGQGAMEGASAAAGKQKEGRLADLIRNAISLGQVVLVAETTSEQETTIARQIMQAAVDEYKDISTA